MCTDKYLDRSVLLYNAVLYLKNDNDVNLFTMHNGAWYTNTKCDVRNMKHDQQYYEI